MRRSYVEQRGAWVWLLGRAVVTLGCVCERPSTCYRVALAAMLARCGAIYAGERPPAPWWPEAADLRLPMTRVAQA